MPQTNQDKRGIWLPNSTGSKWDSQRPAGIDPAPADTLLLSENFESGTLGTFTKWGETTAVVAHQPYSGTYAARSNICGSIETDDPITGLPRDGSYNPEWDLIDNVPSVNSVQYLYIRWRARVDNASGFINTTPGVRPSPKLAYFSHSAVSPLTQCSIYPTLNEVKGIAAIAQNGAAPLPFPYLTGSITGECTGCGFAYDGNYHKFEVLVNRADSTIEFWCNDVKFIANAGQESGVGDGKIALNSDFNLDHIRFWHASSSGTLNSTDGPEPGQYAGGVQIDNAELYSLHDPEVRPS